VLVAFATATRLPAPLHPLSSAPARGGNTKARELDPGSCEPGPSAARRLLQPTQPASTTAGPPDPRLGCERTKLACACALRSPRSPASAPRRTGRNPSAASPPRARVCQLGRSGLVGETPTPATASPTDCVPAPRTGSTASARREAEAPLPGRRRSPAEVSRVRGRARPKPRPATAPTSLRCWVSQAAAAKPPPPARGRLSAAVSERATPTRSARTPLVVRPWHRRLEIPTLARQRSLGSAARYDPTSRAPAPAKGRSPRAPGRPACARPPAAELQHSPCGAPGGLLLAVCRLRGHTRGQGRISRSSAKKTGVRCARGAFHR
jgi:hypothetical protein